MPDAYDDLIDNLGSPAKKAKPPMDYRALYQEVGKKHGVDPDLLYNQAKQESVNFSPHYVFGPGKSSKGAAGLSQFMPNTARQYGLYVGKGRDDRYNPRLAADAQARMMKDLIAKHGDATLALAAYNSGHNKTSEQARRSAQRIPETRGYVQKIAPKGDKYDQLLDSIGETSKATQVDPYDALLDSLDTAAPTAPTKRVNPFARARAGVKGVSPQTIEAPGGFTETERGQPGIPRDRGPAMQARRPGIIERATEAIKPYVPGLTSLDAPMGIKTDPIRGAIRGLTLGAVDAEREITPEERLVNPNAEAQQNLAMGAGETIAGVAPYIGAGKLLSKIPALARATRGAHIVRTALTFGGVETAREAIKAAKTGEPMSPTDIAVSTAMGAAMGGIAGVNPSMKRQIVAFLAPQVAVDVGRGTPLEQAIPNALTTLGFALTSGAKWRPTPKFNPETIRGRDSVPERPETIFAQLQVRGYSLIPNNTPRPSIPRGYRTEKTPDGVVYYDPNRISRETIRNTPTTELLGHVQPKSAATTEAVVARDAQGNEIQSSAVSPENVGKQAEVMAEQYPEAKIETGGPELAADVIAERTAPQRFHSLRFGDVEVTASQEGARAGKLRVAEVNNPEAIHYVKKADLQGRGNAQLLPIKPEVPAVEARKAEPTPPLEAAIPPAETIPVEGVQAKVSTPSQPEQVNAAQTSVEPAREAEVVKPWEMTRPQIEEEFQRKKAEDNNLEASILGPELAKRYARLQRTANGWDTEKADAAYKEVEKIEAALSETDRNRLYGIGETGPQVDELRSYRQSLGNLDDSSPQSLAESMRWAVSRVGNETDPVKMNHDQQVAYGTLREAARIAHENGWDTQAISREAIKAAGQRFSDPEDAAFMLDRFIKKETTPTRPQPKQIAPSQPVEPSVGENLAALLPQRAGIEISAEGLAELARQQNLDESLAKSLSHLGYEPTTPQTKAVNMLEGSMRKDLMNIRRAAVVGEASPEQITRGRQLIEDINAIRDWKREQTQKGVSFGAPVLESEPSLTVKPSPKGEPKVFSPSQGQPPAFERGSDVGDIKPQALADLTESQPFREHGLRGLDVPSQRAVMALVLREIRDPKIRDAVVESVPVDVVDNLMRVKSASDVSLHDKSVLPDGVTVNPDHTISIPIDVADTLVRAVAGSAAKGSSAFGDVGGVAAKLNPAVQADTINQRHVAAPLVESNVSGVPDLKSGTPRILPRDSAATERKTAAPEVKVSESVSESTAKEPTTFQAALKRGRTEYPSEVKAMAAQRSKEDWQVPVSLYIRGKWGSGTSEARFRNHRQSVEQALREGKPVPPEVLADYPDLKGAPNADTSSRATGVYSSELPLSTKSKALEPLPRTLKEAHDMARAEGFTINRRGSIPYWTKLIEESRAQKGEQRATTTKVELAKTQITVPESSKGAGVGDMPAPFTEERPGKFGPGAASAKEPFPEVKERKFGTRFVEDERMVQELRDSIGTAKYYEPIPNKVTAEEASKLVESRGIGDSIKIIKDENNALAPHVRSTMGQIVIQRLNQTYRNLKTSNPKEAEFVLDQATDLAEWQMDYGTRLGQGVQSFAMWAKLTPQGKLLSYKRAVDKARQRHMKFAEPEVREAVDTLNKKGLTDEERLAELNKLFKKNATVRKARPSWQKLIEAAKDGKLTDTLFYDIVGDRLGLPGYSKEIARRITELADLIEQAPEGMPKDKAVLELNKFIAQQKGFGAEDLPIGIYYGNILSGYNTHIVNTIDTAFNVISEVNGLAMNNPRAAAKIYGGMLRGFSDGKLDALLALTQGRMVTDGKWLEVPRLMDISKFGKKGGVPIRTDTRVGRATKLIAESPIGTPLNAYKYVTRLLAASDAVFFRSAKEARASLLADRMARNEGLRGDELDARVRDILALDRRADFLKQAEREGFTGAEAKVRAAELVEMVRDKDISSDAAEFAGEATYNHTPHGALGYASEVIGNWAQKYKALKLFVPFTRIVANVTNRGLNYTPYGYKRAFMGYSHGEVLTPEARRLMITRATMGTVGLVGLGTLQAAGLIQIHGNGPSDREKRRQLQGAGWRPYSIQIGDKYISYVYTPLSLGLSVVGNMTDSQRYHELEQKDAATRGAYAIARLGSTVFSQSFLSGLSRLFDALSNEPAKSITAVKQTLSSTAAAATTPNIARDIYRLFDNKSYQSNTLMEDLVRSTPFASIYLKPTLNAFGEPVRLQRQRFFDVLTSDPSWRFVISKGLRVPVPSKTGEVSKGRRITPEEYYDLLSKTGPRMKQWIKDNQQKLDTMTEDDAQDELSKQSGVITKDEMNKLRDKLGIARDKPTGFKAAFGRPRRQGAFASPF